MPQTDLFYRFGVALAIGLLVGMQREYAKGGGEKEISAGERTLALVGLLGCAAAMAADKLSSPWPLVSVILAISALFVATHFVGAWRGKVGLTTEVAVLVTLIVGAFCYWGSVALAVAIGVATTVLLSVKMEMNVFISRITREDIYAVLKFAVITAIVLPVLPDQTYGPPPLNVLNPHNIWLMVVFISGISFLGYLLVQVIDPRRGIGLTGLLGGLASSTAVTLSFSQRSQRQSELAKPFALAIMVAWTVMFSRVLIEVAALEPALLRFVWAPLAASAAAGLAYCVYLYFAQHPGEGGDVEISNPFELGPAIKFGLIYALILLVSKTAQTYLGSAGFYISSIVSGFADVDAVTLSVAELTSPGGLELSTAARAIVLAAMANTVTKGGIVLMSGSRYLRRALLPGFALMLVVGVSVVFLI